LHAEPSKEMVGRAGIEPIPIPTGLIAIFWLLSAIFGSRQDILGGGSARTHHRATPGAILGVRAFGNRKLEDAIMRDDACSTPVITVPRIDVDRFTGSPGVPMRRLPICAYGTGRLLAIMGLAVGMLGSVDAATFTIAKLYSDQTGSTQYIELQESSSDGRVGPLAGSIITVRHGDVVKQYVIPTDVPAGFPAGGTLLIATSDDLSTGEETPPMSIPPDYVMPVRFLPTDGGTIDLDGYDPWTFDSLPIEGSLALLRSGATTTSTTHSFAAGSHSIVFGAGYSGAFEYYNPDLGQYFYTASEPDIDAIESGRLPGWQSTGTGLAVLTGPYPECCGLYGKVPVSVCRYFIPPAGHFYSAFTNECDQVATQFPSLVLETRAAFYVVLPKDQESGDCPVPSRPVYRLWNRETNAHRFVDSLDRRLPLLAQGWIPEGYGPAGVAWCQ
jgi:hypothetical protein